MVEVKRTMREAAIICFATRPQSPIFFARFGFCPLQGEAWVGISPTPKEAGVAQG